MTVSNSIPGRCRFAASLVGQVKAAMRRELQRRGELRWAYLFGSAARGEEFADADVAVMPAPGSFESLLDVGVLGAELSREIGVDGLTVDVVDLRAASLPFLAEMLDQAVVLLDRKPGARRFWEADVTLRWLDFRPLWVIHERLRRRQLMEGTWSSASELKGS